MQEFLRPPFQTSEPLNFNRLRKIESSLEPHIFCQNWEEMHLFESKETNLVVLKRQVPPCPLALGELLYHPRGFAQTSIDREMDVAIIPAILDEDLDLQAEDSIHLYTDIEDLARNFFSITGAKTIGVRLERVDDDKCRAFHVDFVSARLLTTYFGAGTHWLKNQDVNRSFLGQGDNASVQARGSELQIFEPGWIGILKGEKNNKGSGLVHRSPPIELSGSERILLRMDVLA